MIHFFIIMNFIIRIGKEILISSWYILQGWVTGGAIYLCTDSMVFTNQLTNASEEFLTNLVIYLLTTWIHGNPNWVYRTTWLFKAVAVYNSLFLKIGIYPCMPISYSEHYLNGQKSQLSKQIPHDIGIIELSYSCG